MSKKVFIGLDNISSQIMDFSHGFRQIGYEVISAVHSGGDTAIRNTVVDYDFSDFKMRYFGGVRPRTLQKKMQDWYKEKYSLKNKVFKKALKECHYFIFMWSTFERDYSDLEILKQHGKKIFIIFVGDDVRWYPAMKQEYMSYGMKPIEYSGIEFDRAYLSRNLGYMRIAEKYADALISHPTHSQLSLRDFYLGQVPLRLENFKVNDVQNKIPLIIHAPSSSDIKGTKYVLETVDTLKKEGVKFNFELIKGLEHKKALEKYSEADILVGQLLCPPGGKQERECLACGTVVLSSAGYDYAPSNEGSPIIDVNPDNLTEKLRDIISDYPKRAELATRGRPYVEKFHNAADICRGYIEKMEGTSSERSFTPDFFRNKFIPEKENIDLYNSLTESVSNCDWYKKIITPGERAGLRF